MSCTKSGLEETIAFIHELNSSLEIFHRFSSTANQDLLESTSASFEDETNKRNELCPCNEDKFFITNMQQSQQNYHNTITKISSSTSSTSSNYQNSTMNMNETMKQCQPRSTTLGLSSIEVMKKGQSQQQALQSISSYLIEVEDLSKPMVDNNFCNTCSESFYVCLCCAPANLSSSTALSSLKPAMTNSTCQSLFERTDILSSTRVPKFNKYNKNILHSTLKNNSNNQIVSNNLPKKNKKENKRFELLKNCVFPSRKRMSKVKKQESKNYKFKLISTNTGYKLKNQTKSNTRKRFPRTSSFNSNDDERDGDLTDFYENSVPQIESKQSQVNCESFLPVASDQKAFNNYGDFLVWYV